LGISRSGGARNPHVFQYTLRFLRSGGTRPPFARDGFFTNSQSVDEYTPAPSRSAPRGLRYACHGIGSRPRGSPKRIPCAKANSEPQLLVLVWRRM
ncbi:MAG: hypothetical protein ACREYE_09920, partial [Gammaproteobacteria bacterium]